MPIKNDPSAVRAQIDHALRNNILSSREANRLLREIKKDGVTEEEVSAVVEQLKAAMAGGPDSVSIDLSTASRKRTLNRFLGRLNEEHPLPLEGAGEAGTVNNWLKLMVERQRDEVPVVLPEKSFGGKEVGIDNDGEIVMDGHRFDLSGEPSAELHEALWALNRPHQLDGLSAESRSALNEKLLGLVQEHVGVANDAPGKYNKLVAVNAAAGVLASNAESWDAATCDQVIALAKEVPTPMTKAILLRGLESASLTPEQKAALGDIEKPEHAEALLKAYDDMRGEHTRIGYDSVKGPAVQIALSAMSFAKSQNSIDNILDGMKAWKDLNRDYSKPWDDEEIGHMSRILNEYVDKYPQTAFVFGTFAKEAPKRMAEVTNARAVAKVAPQLEADPPTLEGFPLTREQADYVKTLLPNVRDEAAVEKMVSSLNTAASMFQPSLPSLWGSPQLPDEPMPQAAFELFKSATSNYQETVEASKDGKLDYNDFSRQFRNTVSELHDAIKPRMAELNGTPPRWGEVTLSDETAAFVKEQLMAHTRSTMSIDNIGRAIEVFAKQNGGEISGDVARKFEAMVTEYKANWPDLKTFDFNKLERIASYKVQGKEVPLCTINGQQVGLAEFYGKVGTSVASAIDPSRQAQPWMPDRWGYRAAQAVELLDVVAEQTLRGEGPVAKLREQYPGKEIEIITTGRDGANEQFLYAVKDGDRTLQTYAQGSDGTLAPYRGRTNPILFTATIGDAGELNVEVPDEISVHRYPLQTTYDVGDKIDINYFDPDATENQEEGEAFSTRSKVLEAEILSYDANGNYQVKFTNPKGEEVTKTVSLADIRRANNPHYFKAKASYFSDVNINIKTDEALAKFLEGAQPIIDSYLPADGSTITMSPKELAKRQKECIAALMKYTRERIDYPDHEGPHADEASKKYHEITEGYGRFPLGELVKLGKGVCRHQCILEHLLLQKAGIESRLASGAANTSSGNFRGYHIWTEVTLADNERYLSDQTWDDVTIPLWEGAYGTDKRRIEMYNRTARYDYAAELPQ